MHTSHAHFRHLACSHAWHESKEIIQKHASIRRYFHHQTNHARNSPPAIPYGCSMPIIHWAPLAACLRTLMFQSSRYYGNQSSKTTSLSHSSRRLKKISSKGLDSALRECKNAASEKAPICPGTETSDHLKERSAEQRLGTVKRLPGKRRWKHNTIHFTSTPSVQRRENTPARRKWK